MDELWMYRCRLIRIVDGDTFDVTIDLGLRTYADQRIRLLGVNAPEMHGPSALQGMAARAFVVGWWVDDPTRKWTHRIRTTKSDDFGRWLGTIWNSDGESLADALLASGNAVIYRA
jgi:micrococcal nuclease